MKPSIPLVLLTLFLALALPLLADGRGTSKTELRHFVALKFKDTTTKEQVHEIEEAFQSLKPKIPEVVSIEWGVNISPEKLNKGFSDGFLVTFHTAKDRDAYLNHPEHLKFKEKALPLVADVFILDFWGNR